MVDQEMKWPCCILLFSVMVMLSPVLSEDCPSLPARANQSLPYALNVREKDSEKKSEFLCDFIWTDFEHLKEKLLDRLTQRQKTFVRFTVPVLGFNNPYLSMVNYSGCLTWTWVLGTHDYMLYYPHNFIVISIMTMGIITQDWAIDYINAVPVSLKECGVDPDWFDTDDVVGFCDPECVKANLSCGIGKYELEKLLLNISDGKDKFKWNWLCLQSSYDVLDIVPVPNFAFPDLLYYWRFLSMLRTRRPKFGTMQTKTDFPNYYCYNRKDKCEVMELLSHYWLVPTIGLLLWLYCPLLIHYFPSSTPKKSKGVSKDMFPSYKTPIYFGRCLKQVLCFYTQKGMPRAQYLIRLRRLLFLILLVVTSLRLFIQPPYYKYSLPLLVCSVLAALVPIYLSEHITAKLPSQFLFWDLPPGLVRAKSNLVEYQQLAHVMQERMYLTVDEDFWKFVFRSSFHYCYSLYSSSPRNTCEFFVVVMLTPLALLFSSLVFIIVFISNLLFYFIPLPYFYFTLLRAVCTGEFQYIQRVWRQSSMLWLVIKLTFVLIHSILMIGLVFYTLVVTFIWCYAVSEFTMFTFIGGVLTASMAFQYFVLIGSIVTAIYALVRDLHEWYDRILEEVINILKEKKIFEKLAGDVHSGSGNTIIFEEQPPNEKITVRKAGQSVPHCLLLTHDGITTYVDKRLYNDIVEKCRPLRRQILFIVLKIIAILFYSFVALWVKNVYHMEEKVGNIFQVVQTVAVFFLPSALQFISYKSHFGKKKDILREEIYDSLVEYLCEI